MSDRRRSFERRADRLQETGSELLELFEAGGANESAVKINEVLHLVAEDAAGGVFFEDDGVLVGEDLKRVFIFDIEGLADLGGEHDSSKLVYFACHSG